MAIYGCYLLLSQCLLAALGPVPSFFESSVAHLHGEQFKGNQRDEVQHEPSPESKNVAVLFLIYYATCIHSLCDIGGGSILLIHFYAVIAQIHGLRYCSRASMP